MGWERVCKADELAPGEMRPVSAGGIEMVLLRSPRGFVAIPPSCPHMANALVDGFFDGCVLTCNKHLWQWTIPDGLPTGGEAEAPLLTYESEEREGAVWVNVERELAYEHEK